MIYHSSHTQSLLINESVFRVSMWKFLPITQFETIIVLLIKKSSLSRILFAQLGNRYCLYLFWQTNNKNKIDLISKAQWRMYVHRRRYAKKELELWKLIGDFELVGSDLWKTVSNSILFIFKKILAQIVVILRAPLFVSLVSHTLYKTDSWQWMVSFQIK